MKMTLDGCVEVEAKPVYNDTGVIRLSMLAEDGTATYREVHLNLDEAAALGAALTSLSQK